MPAKLTTKRCRTCAEILPIDLFIRTQDGKYRSDCSLCAESKADRISKKSLKEFMAIDPLDFSDLDARGSI